ncbi:hypothetical protein Pelo_9687 [Pelomyxa schiedti]|nr:hypothetical protein Pelo_9687 [Pelomyxa schiedti]
MVPHQFSLKKVFHMLTSTSSVECLFEKALERHRNGNDGLLFQMLKFCAVRIRNLPLFTKANANFMAQQTPTQSNQDEEQETSAAAPRKRSLEERAQQGHGILINCASCDNHWDDHQC